MFALEPASAAMNVQQLAGNINVVRNALNAFYAPNATNEVIKHNEAIVQEFKQSLNPESAVAAARLLLEPILQDRPASDFETNYALQLISERILLIPPWLGHPESVRASVRQLAIDLVMHTTPKHSNMVQEKVAYLIVSLAVREWPQHWASFLDDLLAGALPPQMVLIVLRLLSEEVYEFGGSIAAIRKNELSQVMTHGVTKMLPFITKAMDSFINSNDSSGMRAAMGVIEAFMIWVPVEILFEMRIPNACLSLLNHPQYAVSALTALQALLKRNKLETGYHIGYRKEVFPALVNYTLTHMKSLQTLSYAAPMGVIPESAEAFRQSTFHANAVTLQDIDNDMHEYTIKFVTMLAKLGSSAFVPSYVLPSTKENGLDPVEQQTATAYVDIMLSSIANPSLLIRNAGMSFFNSLFAVLHRSLHKHFRDTIIKPIVQATQRSRALPKPPVNTNLIMEALKNQFIRDLFFNLVKRFVNSASVALVRWPKDPLLEAFAEEDFAGDVVLLNQAWNSFKMRAAQNISLATKLEPVSIMNIVLDRLVDLLGKANAIDWPKTTVGENGVAPVPNGKYPFVSGLILLEDSPRAWTFGNFNQSHSKVIVAALDGAILASEAVLAMLTSIEFFMSNPASNASVQNLFNTILSLSQPNLQAAKVSSLRMFIPLYKTNKDALQMCLQCLCDIAESSKKSTLCFRACTSLSAICRRLYRSRSKTLKEFLMPLRDFALRVQTDTNYAPVERNLVIDSAIAVSHLAGDVNEQTEVVESLINPLMGILDKTGMTACVGDPQQLYQYLDAAPQSEVALGCLATMENAMSQIVRSNRVRTGPGAITTPLTHSIAPKTVTFGAMLVTTLHAMYNPNQFPISDPKRKSVLEPTSREVATLLNLNEGKDSAVWLNPVSGSSNELGEYNTENDAKTALERADDLLARLGIRVPDPRYGKLRENFKNLRLYACNLLKSSILSGACMSATHLEQMLKAICSNMQYLEPIHADYLVRSVVRPLLSWPVVQANPEFLGMVANSEIPAFIEMLRKMIEQSNRGEVDNSVSSTLFALEVSRDHGRKLLAKTSADMLTAIFPREYKRGMEHVPQVFSHPALFQSLNALWDVLCNPTIGVTDNASPRAALNLVARAIEWAPESAKQLYSSKLAICLETAFRTDGMGSDSPAEAAVGAVMAFFKKWPEESSGLIMNMIAGSGAEFQQTIANKLKEYVDSTKSPGGNKKSTGRSRMRSIIRTMAKKAGVSARKEVIVESLPTKPSILRRPSRSSNKDDEMQLADSTLDSLFGGGEPL